MDFWYNHRIELQGLSTKPQDRQRKRAEKIFEFLGAWKKRKMAIVHWNAAVVYIFTVEAYQFIQLSNMDYIKIETPNTIGLLATFLYSAHTYSIARIHTSINTHTHTPTQTLSQHWLVDISLNTFHLHRNNSQQSKLRLTENHFQPNHVDSP